MGTRRHFLKYASVACGSAAALGAGLGVAGRTSPAASPEGAELRGRLLCAGFGAKRSSAQAGHRRSVITEVTLPSGQARQTWVDLPNAHALLTVAPDELLVLPLDGAEALFVATTGATHRLPGPVGFLYSGHGVLAPGGKLAFVSLRKSPATLATDTGRIGVVDVATRRLVALLDSGGVRPHDLALLDGGKRLAVSHYGDLNYESSGKTSLNVREPRLVILDVPSGRKVQVLAAPSAGSLTHIATDAQGTVCGVPLNYYGLDDQGMRAVESQLGGGPFEISVAEELEGRIAQPMPVYLFNLAGGSLRQLPGDPVRQRRAQSVAYHAGSDQFFATYTFSDSLACISESGVRYVSAFTLGLSYLRGVCAIGTTAYVAVTGQFRGVAVVHGGTMNVALRLDVPLFDSPHVVWTV